MQQGMSLQDVERRSDGKWKAAVVGSYERGDRNISAARLCELAEFYGVSPSEVLPRDDTPQPVDQSRGVVIDLSKLDDSDRWAGVKRYCESIQVERGDFNRQVLSVRAADLRALAVIMGTQPDALVDGLRDEGILAEG
ncbi:MAG: transcriptional regulator [Actinobacteria bacterium]|nr:transcriptional regulator [Actinomycetota bacterium]